MKNRPKIFLCLSILILSTLFLTTGMSPSKQAKADTTYHTPLRSWIRVGGYGSSDGTAADIAKHNDWINNPSPVSLSNSLNQLTDAPMTVYDNIYCLYVGDAKYAKMIEWANNQGLTADQFEDMFLHYSVDTTVTYSGEAHTIPAENTPGVPRSKSRVPTYGWYGTGGDTSLNDARVIMNAGNANYRAFNAYYMNYKVTQFPDPANNSFYDGVFVDNTSAGILTATGTIVGGAISQYSSCNGDRSCQNSAYANDIMSDFHAVRDLFVPQGKIIAANVGTGWRDEWVSCDGKCFDLANLEKVLRPVATDANLANFQTVNAQMVTAGISPVMAAIQYANLTGGNCNTGDPINSRKGMDILSIYYLTAAFGQDAASYFKLSDFIWSSNDCNWMGAINFNVGAPVDANMAVTKTGVDPVYPHDAGNGQIVVRGTSDPCHAGATCALVDPTKNWATDQWVTDDNGNRSIYIYSLVDQLGTVKNQFANNDATSIWWYQTGEQALPISGNYELGRAYSIYKREYQNALMLYKTGPNGHDDDANAATSYTLPEYTMNGNSSNRYYKLKVDGTIDYATGVLTSVNLRNHEGAILIKEAALNRPSISKTVDKSSASSGDVVTYTINYSNPSSINFANVKIADPLPTGATFDSIVSGGATYDGTNVVLDLGNLSPNANGVISFKVKIN